METTERSTTERPTTFPPEPDLDAAFDEFVACLREVLATDPDALPELAPGP
ncbi:MAG TPA: hypothetical protein VFG23_05455 [Polyangia bacterium]|nr:hypothetical protein [Polyangia bacterium]